MKIRSAITSSPYTFGLSVLLLGGSIAGVTTSSFAVATGREQSRAEQQGRNEAGEAQAALTKGEYGRAIRHAEAAVAYQPQAASYRMTLGQSYLKAGRFGSARAAFADVLTLDPDNGKAALNFALAQIATGDWAGARKTLDVHAAAIPVADRGLAIALAGDPTAAVALLDAPARASDADAKVRQNYALSLALAGRWREAQTVVAIDVAPADVARRILDWSTFSRPTSASDQVATLLGVTPVVDPGQPTTLALNLPVGEPATALAAADRPLDSFMPGKADAAASEPVALTAVAPERRVGPSIAGVVFAERKEVVQPLPAVNARVQRLATVKSKNPAVAVADAARAFTQGGFVVQLGAYQNAGVARDAWGRASRRYTALAGHIPQGMSITARGKSFYRLSVGGFVRREAVSLCQRYRSSGGTCFVRAGAGDQIASWARGRELASR